VRFPDVVLPAALAAGLLVAADVTPCRADTPIVVVSSAASPAPDTALAPRPGTDEEERAYARREAESPDAQEFAGGQVIELLLLVVIVLVIILLVKKV
jgi:hypothetical protein